MPGLDPSAGIGGVMPDEGGGGNSGLSSVLQQIMLKNYIQGALLGFAQPTWGGAGNAAYNAAAGATNAESATNEAVGKESVREAESEQHAELAREQMASHEKTAEITGASREAAAEIRGKYGLERANIALQKAPVAVANKYLESARKVLGVDTNPTLMTLDPITRSQMIQHKAAELYQAAIDMGMEKPGAGAGTPAGATGPSAKGADAGGDDSGGGVVPGKIPAAGGEGGPLDLGKMMADPTHGARVKSMMSTPEGQAQLLKMNPSLKPQIDAYNNKGKSTNFPFIPSIPGATGWAVNKLMGGGS